MHDGGIRPGVVSFGAVFLILFLSRDLRMQFCGAEQAMVMKLKVGFLFRLEQQRSRQLLVGYTPLRTRVKIQRGFRGTRMLEIKVTWNWKDVHYQCPLHCNKGIQDEQMWSLLTLDWEQTRPEPEETVGRRIACESPTCGCQLDPENQDSVLIVGNIGSSDS
jgi:hypothetical protein